MGTEHVLAIDLGTGGPKAALVTTEGHIAADEFEPTPLELLGDLVAMYDEGRSAPLPLPVKTSYAWAKAVHTHGDPDRAAKFRWQTNRYPGEDQDPAQVRAWGKGAWLKVLVDVGLDDYACRLWFPMLRALGR